MGRKIWGNFLDSANKASFALWGLRCNKIYSVLQPMCAVDRAA
jgi:hypothetical protein